jgi:hypothetical protein
VGVAAAPATLPDEPRRKLGDKGAVIAANRSDDLAGALAIDLLLFSWVGWDPPIALACATVGDCRHPVRAPQSAATTVYASFAFHHGFEV